MKDLILLLIDFIRLNTFRVQSNLDKEYKDELLQNIVLTKQMSSLSPTWKIFLDDLRKEISILPITKILRWRTIRKTMFFEGFPRSLYNEIYNDSLFNNYVKEDSFGSPYKSKCNSNCSDNLLHHVQSLRQVVNDISINNIHSVYEFGAGYGSMARLFFKINSSISYTISDLPIFSKIQEIYLKNTIKNVQHIKWRLDFTSRIEVDLFISTWAISEVSNELRKKVFDSFNSNYYLIAFQKYFDGIDNLKYFNDFAKILSKTHHCNIHKISYLPNNYYFVAESK